MPVSQLAPPVFGGEGASSELIDIFTEYTSSDIHDSAQVISLLKAFLIVKDVPIREVHIEASDEIIDGVAYVVATDAQIQTAVEEFTGEKDSKGRAAARTRTPSRRAKSRRTRRRRRTRRTRIRLPART